MAKLMVAVALDFRQTKNRSLIDSFPDIGKSKVQMQPIAWSALEKFFQQAIWLLLFFILAPILGPRPYGQFAIVMVVIGVCESVLATPAVEALLSMDPLEPNHLRTANLAGFVLAVLAGGMIFLSAPYIGQVFGDAELGSIFKIMSVLPATAILTTTPIAVLKSHLLFRPLALRTILSLARRGRWHRSGVLWCWSLGSRRTSPHSTRSGSCHPLVDRPYEVWPWLVEPAFR